MTLVAWYACRHSFALVGDLLLSGPVKPSGQLRGPTVLGLQARENRGSWPQGATRKVLKLSERSAVGWSGNLAAATKVLRAVKQDFDPDASERTLRAIAQRHESELSSQCSIVVAHFDKTDAVWIVQALGRDWWEFGETEKLQKIVVGGSGALHALPRIRENQEIVDHGPLSLHAFTWTGQLMCAEGLGSDITDHKYGSGFDILSGTSEGRVIECGDTLSLFGDVLLDSEELRWRHIVRTTRSGGFLVHHVADLGQPDEYSVMLTSSPLQSEAKRRDVKALFRRQPAWDAPVEFKGAFLSVCDGPRVFGSVHVVGHGTAEDPPFRMEGTFGQSAGISFDEGHLETIVRLAREKRAEFPRDGR